MGDSLWVFVCQINDGDVQTGPKEDCAGVRKQWIGKGTNELLSHDVN